MKRFHWTPAWEALLREHYPHVTAQAMADAMGASVRAVYSKAAALGLKKSEAFYASDLAKRIQCGHTDPRMVASRIQPGATPWNKGVKGSTGLHDNCKRTQFKPGRRPEESHNYAPIGTLRLSKDGYLERKFTDDTHLPAPRRWVAVHRQVWEAAHGAIPAGHIVVFRPGQATAVLDDITPERLECISRVDNVRRNSPYTRSPEYGRLVQLKGAITRQVNRINRENQKEQSA